MRLGGRHIKRSTTTAIKKLRQSAKLKTSLAWSVASLLAFVVSQNLRSIERFGFILNQRIWGLFHDRYVMIHWSYDELIHVLQSGESDSLLIYTKCKANFHLALLIWVSPPDFEWLFASFPQYFGLSPWKQLSFLPSTIEEKITFCFVHVVEVPQTSEHQMPSVSGKQWKTPSGGQQRRIALPVWTEAIDVMYTDEQRYKVTTHSMNTTECMNN